MQVNPLDQTVAAPEGAAPTTIHSFEQEDSDEENQVVCHGPSNRGKSLSDSLSPLAARSDFGADDGGAAPMRMLAPPRTPMIRAYPPDFPLRLRAVPPHLGRQG